VSTCVTEEKNDNNVPTMFYTPNKEDYVQNLNLMPGMKQEIIFGEIDFKMSKLNKFELTKCEGMYSPMILSINYNDNGQNFAFISYCVFTRDSNKQITGARSVK
jgi:hypothetical protein